METKAEQETKIELVEMGSSRVDQVNMVESAVLNTKVGLVEVDEKMIKPQQC